MADLVMDIEDVFDITIPEETEGRIRTVGDCYTFILTELKKRDMRRSRIMDAPEWTDIEIFHQLRAIAVQKLKVPIERVTMKARWVEDLGAD